MLLDKRVGSPERGHKYMPLSHLLGMIVQEPALLYGQRQLLYTCIHKALKGLAILELPAIKQ